MPYIGPNQPAYLLPGSVSNVELANMPEDRIKGRSHSGTGDPQDLTADQVIAVLNTATAATLDGDRLASYYRGVGVDGTGLTQRPTLNLVSGSGIALSGADDGVNFESDVTIALAAIGANSLLGNNTAGSAVPGALSANDVLSLLNTASSSTLDPARLGALSPSPLGTYTAATVTIDNQGRVTNASSTANLAFLDAAQSFTAAQRGSIGALTDGATITPDFALANNYSVTLGGNRTLANPTNLTAGQSGCIYITQDGTGSRTLAYGNAWDFGGGTVPTLSTAANAVDVLAYAVRTTGSIAATLIKDVK